MAGEDYTEWTPQGAPRDFAKRTVDAMFEPATGSNSGKTLEKAPRPRKMAVSGGRFGLLLLAAALITTTALGAWRSAHDKRAPELMTDVSALTRRLHITKPLQAPRQSASPAQSASPPPPTKTITVPPPASMKPAPRRAAKTTPLIVPRTPPCNCSSSAAICTCVDL